MGLSNIVVKFLHKGRFFLLQHFNRNVNVVVDGTPNILLIGMLLLWLAGI